jgi:hypothetical protein
VRHREVRHREARHREARRRQVRIIRDYGMHDRREAPQYYRAVAPRRMAGE